jgi:hypothetical protein
MFGRKDDTESPELRAAKHALENSGKHAKRLIRQRRFTAQDHEQFVQTYEAFFYAVYGRENPNWPAEKVRGMAEGQARGFLAN